MSRATTRWCLESARVSSSEMARRLVLPASPMFPAERSLRMFDNTREITRVQSLATLSSDGPPATREFLGALVSAVVDAPSDQTLQDAFERQLLKLLPIRRVKLRALPASHHARLVTPARTADSIVLDVPVADRSRQVILELTFETRPPMEAPPLDQLRTAAQLGALVIEADRSRIMAAARPTSGAALPLIGSNGAMEMVRERAERVAATDFTVLVEGESGTGKELVARQIHDLSRRRSGPFVAVNCAALVETLLEAELFGIEERTATGVRGRRGKFEHAHGGTLFLDEVSDLSISAQAKLLRAIQELAVERVGGQGARRVDVRIVAASNRRLSDMVASGLFRADLFYRLSGVEIHIPPLRLRPDDIAPLAVHFLSRHNRSRQLTLSESAQQALRLYPWPGNVRELERLIERVIALAAGDRIELEDLPPQVRGDYAHVVEPAMRASETMRAWGSRYAQLMFERCGCNKRRTCTVLGISYHTLDAYLRYAQKRAGGRKQMPAWVAVRKPDCESRGSGE